jgi:glyoxylase-like metal-dependent hydrolase (beta-lactamase superfamily II)
MLQRKTIFPHVIELNFQAGQLLLGSNVYLVFDADEWILIDIGYLETVDEIVDLIRQLDFPLSHCKAVVASHSDVDHVQGLAAAKQALRTQVLAHPQAASLLERGDRVQTFAEIAAQSIDLEMPPVKIDRLVDEGDSIQVGGLTLHVWSTPGHAAGHLSFQMGDLLFSADNIYRDGCVGAIDAHHGSDLLGFIKSLRRIRDSEVKWLLPSHGPIFRKDDAILDAAIERLGRYLHMADFGTCAADWPLLDEWEREIAEGKGPQ